MKTSFKLAALAVALATCNLQLATTARAQGSLTPPSGAPAPVMKSLDQLEPRTPLIAGQSGVTVGVAGNITITKDGSYYLTTNLVINTANVHGIDVGTQTVTIDLNGFSIIMTSISQSGSIGAIYIGGNLPGQRVTIRNGNIAGGGTNSTGIFGIYQSGLYAPTTVEGVKCYKLKGGIFLNSGSQAPAQVQNCMLEEIGASTGIFATQVSRCMVRRCLGIGISATQATECWVDSSPGFGGGNYAISAVVANGCYVQSGTNLITYKYNMP